MSKLDVGVGDEFPADEIRTDQDGVVHHHHYYYRRRRGPFRFLRFVLWITLMGMLFRVINLLTGREEWYGPRHAAYDLPIQLGGMAAAVAIIAGVLWLLRCRDEDVRR